MPGQKQSFSPREEELRRSFPAAYQAFLQVAPGIRERLIPQAFQEWVEEGVSIASHSFRSWEAAAEYFMASVQVLDLLSLPQFFQWARQGRLLSQRSPELASAFFRASPRVLPQLMPYQVGLWAGLGGRLYKGSWQSSSLATRFFEASPRLLRDAPLGELESLVHLLETLGERIYPMAQRCLDLAVDLFPRLEKHQREPVLALARALGGTNPSATLRVLEAAPRAIHRIERGQQHRFLSVAEKMVWLDGEAPMAFLLEGSLAMDQIERSLHQRILVLAEELVLLSCKGALEFVKSCPDVLKRIRSDELESWCQEGIEALKEKEETGIAYFKLESYRAEEVLKNLSKGVELAQVLEILHLYCKALAGVNVQVMPLESLTRKGIGWTSERKPTTDGTNIFLPSLVQEFDSKRANFTCLKVYATHQAGHLEFGSFYFQFNKEGKVFPPLRWELEALKAPLREEEGSSHEKLKDMERFFDLFPSRRLAADIFTVVEDARIDYYLALEYGGIKGSLKKLQKDARLKRPPTSSLSIREAVLEALLQTTLDDTLPVLLPSPFHIHFQAALGFLRQALVPESTVGDSAEAALRIYPILSHIPNLPSGSFGPEDWQPVGAGDASGSELFKLIFGASEVSPRSLAALLGEVEGEPDEEDYQGLIEVDFRGDFKPELVQTLMRLNQKEKDGDSSKSASALSPEALKDLLDKLGETEVSELLVGDLDVSSGLFITNLLRETGQNPSRGKKDGIRSRLEEEGPEGEPMEVKEPLSFLYDEWDFRANDYRPNWCLLREKPLEGGTAQFYEEVLKKYSKSAHQVRRQFELLKPELFKKIKKLPDGEEFDLDSVVEAVAEKKAGQTPSEKLYWRRNKEERSVAVAFLLDMSASTDEDVSKEKEKAEDWDLDWDEDPRPYFQRLMELAKNRPKRRRIIDLEKESLTLLTQALETVGDTYGIYGFSGYGRDNVEFFVIKDLDVAFSDRVKGRIEKMEPVRGTRMGPAIRHVTAKLAPHDARVKILFLLSDGRPQDHNYGRDRTEKEYAIHDTHMALVEAKRKEIVPFCLTVDPDGHDYLKVMCGDLGYEVVNDVEALPERLPTLYRMLTV